MAGSARTRALWLFLLAVALCSCGGDPPRLVGSPPGNVVLPDFQLVDVNPNSATSGQAVSPRDYLHKVSAWYFGHST